MHALGIMKTHAQLNHPWLLAVWPGMGSVAVSAGYYLISKLGMHLLKEYPPQKFFELSHVEVKNGLIQTARLPRSRLFLWRDPQELHDLIIFMGEAQPASHGNAFCSHLIQDAQRLGVQDVFTFAAMASRMRPEEPSRIFGAAINRECLSTFKAANIELMEEGKISGLNGVLLEIAAESGMHGGCLLGEMPYAFPQLPFPKASLAVLQTFTAMAGITIDFAELRAQADKFDDELGKLLYHLEDAIEHRGEAMSAEQTAQDESEPESEELSLDRADQQLIEELFESARIDRSRAYELKQELDRLHVFHEYEDRFLDLFRTS